MKLLKNLFTGLLVSLIVFSGVQAGIGGGGISTQFWKPISSTAIAPISDTFELGSSTNRITKIWSDALDSTTATIASFSLGTVLTDIINEATSGVGVTIEGILNKDGYQVFKTGISPPAHIEGGLFYDESNKTLSLYNNEADVTLRMGSTWERVKNNTGSTITNGQVVYVNGEDTGLSTVALANAGLGSTSQGTLGIATHDIETATIGIITTLGVVRDVDTSSFTAGDILYLSNTNGGMTNVRPSAPSFSIILGTAGTINATTGTINVHINTGTNLLDTFKMVNGSVLEDTSTAVTSDGVTVTLSYEKDGGGDLSLLFDGAFTTFDSTPLATIALTAGSDVSSQGQWIYIPESTGVLTASLTGYPTTEQYVPVAWVDVPSATFVQTKGLYGFQAWTDHLSNSVDQGHLSDINFWIRQQPATDDNPTTGLLLSVADGVATYDISTIAGSILQLHPQSVPAMNTATGSNVYIFNDSVTANKEVGDMTGELTDALGVTMSGKYYNIFYYAISNEDNANSKMFAQLPSCSYNSSSNAISDVGNCNNELIPSKYKSTALPIARVTMRNQSGAAGTFTEQLTVDLRATGGTGGSAANVVTSFPDSDLEVTNVLDPTKIFNFDASGITTATTRTYTAPDASGTLFLNGTALSDGTTATTQAVADNSTKVSTTAYADAAAAAAGGGFTPSYSSSTVFETSTRFANSTNGSGSQTYNYAGVSTLTGTTISSSAETQWAVGDSAGNRFRIVSGSPEWQATATQSSAITGNGSGYVGLGEPVVDGSGHTFTTAHIGFKFLKVSGVLSLYATQADGTNETASAALTTIAANDIIEMAIKVNGDSSTDFYWKKNTSSTVGTWSSAVNLATNNPSITALGSDRCQVSVSNDGTTDAMTIRVAGMTYKR